MRLRSLIGRWTAARAGTVGIILSLAAPAIFAALGAAVDYSRVLNGRTGLQSAVDGGALTGASLLRLANSSGQSVQNVVNAQVQSAFSQDTTLAVQTDVSTNEVLVTASRTVPHTIMRIFGVTGTRVTAKARARVAGTRQATCLVTLDLSAQKALSIDNATLSAPGCRVYSDSNATNSISVSNSGQLTTGSACAAGGYATSAGGTYTPQPTTDCPPLSDPLAYLLPPTVNLLCDFTNQQVRAGQVMTLTPGTYCGGINVSGSGQATLQPGTYVMLNGHLTVSGSATLSGTGVSIYFTGTDALLDVSGQTQINLTAPSFGALAGVLLFEDRLAPTGKTHKLNSSNAANLLGTVYLSQNTLQVGGSSTSSGGSAAAWTIAVVRQLQLSQQQTLTFNTNYGATTVPPPSTLVNISSSPSLVQ